MSSLRARIFIIFIFAQLASSFVIVPRAPKGGGGGGGHGSGGRGGGSSGGGKGTSGAGRGGSGGTGHSAVSYGSVNTGGRSANFFSGGGGKSFSLSPPSFFSGRQMGGGTRSQVPGTRSYGSGYPYSTGDGVAGRPFPFGFWPIYWAGHGHSDEYGRNETVAAQRPGGEQVMVELVPNVNASSWNTSAVNGINETYWMIGDRDSVTTLLSLLVDVEGLYPYACGVQNNTIELFNSSDPSLPIHFNNVIEWYRASSFALAYEGYNNTLALNDTEGLGWNESIPLPDEQLYSPFLKCINNTITSALPIIDGPTPPLSAGDIAGIAIGSFFGLLVLICCCHPCYLAVRQARADRKRLESMKVVGAVERTYSYSPTYTKTLYTPSPPSSPYFKKTEKLPAPSISEKSISGKTDRDSSASSITLIQQPGHARSSSTPRSSYHDDRGYLAPPSR